ncbi:MAG: DUF2157 domain-containing protein [Mariprofundaceae bacterium]
MGSPRSQIIDLIENDSIPQENIEQALLVSEVAPHRNTWFHFVDQMMLWLGTLSLAFAVLFFIAYNWSELGRFVKFGLVEALLTLSIAAYWRWGGDTLPGKASLLIGTLLLGALLALYGQTYQTGADTWQLFFNWALLIIPWVIISRFSVIWVLWLALINLSIVLYFQASVNVLWLVFASDSSVLWSLFTLNTLVLVVWEIQQQHRLWMQNVWAVRLIAVGSSIPITWLVLSAIFKSDTMYFIQNGSIWCVWLGALYLFYRTKKPNLFMLAGGCLSAIIVLIVFFSKHFLAFNHMGGFLFIALLTIVLGASAAKWLKNIHQELQT